MNALKSDTTFFNISLFVKEPFLTINFVVKKTSEFIVLLTVTYSQELFYSFQNLVASFNKLKIIA